MNLYFIVPLTLGNFTLYVGVINLIYFQ